MARAIINKLEGFGLSAINYSGRYNHLIGKEFDCEISYANDPKQEYEEYRKFECIYIPEIKFYIHPNDYTLTFRAEGE